MKIQQEELINSINILNQNNLSASDYLSNVSLSQNTISFNKDSPYRFSDNNIIKDINYSPIRNNITNNSKLRESDIIFDNNDISKYYVSAEICDIINYIIKFVDD